MMAPPRSQSGRTPAGAGGDAGRARGEAGEAGESWEVGLATAAVAGPTTTASGFDGSLTPCGICRRDFARGDVAARVGCRHRFRKSCYASLLAALVPRGRASAAKHPERPVCGGAEPPVATFTCRDHPATRALPVLGSDSGSGTGAPRALYRLPPGRVLADSASDWDAAFGQIPEWIGPRGAFRSETSDGSLFSVAGTRAGWRDRDSDGEELGAVDSDYDDVCESDASDAFDGGEYGVILCADAGRGLDLTIVDDYLGSGTSRPAQKCETAGFEYNFPASLQRQWSA
jgi:hypothetical protein